MSRQRISGMQRYSFQTLIPGTKISDLQAPNHTMFHSDLLTGLSTVFYNPFPAVLTMMISFYLTTVNIAFGIDEIALDRALVSEKKSTCAASFDFISLFGIRG
ncbi:hypothetical protein EV426DRAFT_575229 [Tirmania nivea]|nr:hypothetical protein EV426DRAFT_575229 [Tirmania nivea]